MSGARSIAAMLQCGVERHSRLPLSRYPERPREFSQYGCLGLAGEVAVRPHRRLWTAMAVLVLLSLCPRI